MVCHELQKKKKTMDGDERALDSSIAGGAVRGFLKGASKAASASRYDASLQKSAAQSIPHPSHMYTHTSPQVAAYIISHTHAHTHTPTCIIIDYTYIARGGAAISINDANSTRSRPKSS
jgi:hypothetical protein